jgi:hypothetical protein
MSAIYKRSWPLAKIIGHSRAVVVPEMAMNSATPQLRSYPQPTSAGFSVE